ncbi:MAG: O-antigen ligase family protein [Elusimicrobiota bacterium]|nr:O-antigen ligase family protein [Elusimicrobiota bacterium]
MNTARRWLLVTAHFMCPLLFFTNLTRNPYVSQIALLNILLALAVAAWAWRETERPGGARAPALPIAWPLAAFILIWAASWLRAYLGHAEFFRPSIAAEGARGTMFLIVNCAAAFWLAANVAADDDGSSDVPLGPWIGFVVFWGLLWIAFPSMRTRVGASPDDFFTLAWDPYGAFVWAAGLAGAAWLCRRGRVIDFLHLAFAAGFLASVYGVLQYFNYELVWPNVLNPYGGRAVSTFGNPNFLSTYNAALMPSALALFLVEKSGPRRWAYGLLFLVLEAALLATLTRSSWGGAAVGAAALMAAPRLRAGLREQPRAAGLLFGLALALALAWPSSTISSGYTPTFIGRLTEHTEIAKRDGFYSPWHQRVLIWTSSWLMGREEPLLGKGGGLFELFYPFYQGALLHADRFYHTMRTHANNSHNEILEVFAQTGLIGLGAFLWLWTTFFLAAWRWARTKAGGDPVWIGAVAGVAAVLADNLLNVSLHFAVPAFMFWWLAGVAMGRGARDGGGFLPAPGPLAARRAFAAVLTCACLFAAWWQVRFWNREAWYFAGFKQIRQGNMPAAIRSLERSRAWGPREVNAIYELGNAYARSGQPAKAAEAYEGALQANAGYDEIYFNLGTVYASHLGRADKAGGYFETAWALNPLSDAVVNGLSAFYLREPAKHKALAEALLSEATGIFPENTNHWNNLGYLMTIDRRWPEAEAAYARALEIHPDAAALERNLLAVAAQSGRPRAPILDDIAELRSLDADVAKGDWSMRSLRRASALVARRPSFLKARFVYGSLLLANGRAAEGAAELEAVVARDPRRAAPRVNLANAYLALNRPADAGAQLRTALALEPGNAAIRARLAALGLTP